MSGLKYTVGTLTEKPSLLTPDELKLDIVKLVDTRMLVQANSGGGKSMFLRKLAEESCQHIHTLIYDYEGEFTTLREEFDYVLVGEGGEVATDPRTASVLTRRLMDLRLPAIIDLSSLDLAGRRSYVKQSLQALMSLPRSMWHSTMVILDEAHMFCPERSAGDAESTGAVIALMSQGRKRGFCGVLATQRISKLHKDATAECNNVFIGRTAQDIDQRRAADVLGIQTRDRQGLKDFTPGEFYAYGPALECNGVVRFKATKGITTHPEAGKRHNLKPIAPSKAIEKILPELADLTRKDDDAPLTLEDANKTIANLRRELKAQKPESIDQRVLDTEIAKAVTKTIKEVDAHWAKQITEAKRKLQSAIETELSLTPSKVIAVESIKNSAPPVRTNPSPTMHVAPTKAVRTGSTGDASLGKCERAILSVLGMHGKAMSKQQIGILAGYSPKSGGFNNALSKLRQSTFIAGAGDSIEVTDDGLHAVGDFEHLPEGKSLHAWWIDRLPKAEGAILSTLIASYPHKLTKQQIGDATGYSTTSGGFNNALSKLRTLTLIEGFGDITASPSLFE